MVDAPLSMPFKVAKRVPPRDHVAHSFLGSIAAPAPHQYIYSAVVPVHLATPASSLVYSIPFEI